jgi:hypothetical protein
LKIGVDNAITDALTSGKWGIRFTFAGEEMTNRYEVVLTVEEAEALVVKISQAIGSIDRVKVLQKENPYTTIERDQK